MPPFLPFVLYPGLPSICVEKILPPNYHCYKGFTSTIWRRRLRWLVLDSLNLHGLHLALMTRRCFAFNHVEPVILLGRECCVFMRLEATPILPCSLAWMDRDPRYCVIRFRVKSRLVIFLDLLWCSARTLLHFPVSALNEVKECAPVLD